MPKTVFGSTPKPVLPELLNKLLNPTYSQDPQEDGEIKPPTLDELLDVKAAIDLYPQSATYVDPDVFPNDALGIAALKAFGPSSHWTGQNLSVSIVRISQKVFDLSVFADWTGSVPASTEQIDFEIIVPNPTSPAVPKTPLLTDLINARTSADVSDIIAYGHMTLACPESINVSRPASLRAFKTGSGSWSAWSLRFTPALPLQWQSAIGGGTAPRLHARFLIVIP